MDLEPPEPGTSDRPRILKTAGYCKLPAIKLAKLRSAVCAALDTAESKLLLVLQDTAGSILFLTGKAARQRHSWCK